MILGVSWVPLVCYLIPGELSSSRVLKSKGKLILMQNLWKWKFHEMPENNALDTVEGDPVGT